MCRMHAGTKRTGPKGAANGNYRHGNETQEAIAERKRIAALLRDVRDDAEDGFLEPMSSTDWQTMAQLLAALGVKETREMRSARNKAAWAQRDRRAWGGENRCGWPKHPGRNGYRRRRPLS